MARHSASDSPGIECQGCRLAGVARSTSHVCCCDTRTSLRSRFLLAGIVWTGDHRVRMRFELQRINVAAFVGVAALLSFDKVYRNRVEVAMNPLGSQLVCLAISLAEHKRRTSCCKLYEPYLTISLSHTHTHYNRNPSLQHSPRVPTNHEFNQINYPE